MTSNNKSQGGVLKQIPLVLWFLVASLSAIHACGAQEPSNPTTSAAPSPYPILDSGVWADWHGIPQTIYWLDNNRVLFKTVKDNEKKRVTTGPFNLSIWDTTTNKVTPYTDYVNSLTVCYREGFVYYALADDPFYVQHQQKNWRHFAGEFGKEKPFVPPSVKNVRYNDMDCRYHTVPVAAEKLEGPKRHDLRFLLHRHGYLDFGLRSVNHNRKPTLYYRKGKNEPISLPNLSRQYFDYYEFKGAYFVRPIGRVNAVWWLYPDGKLEEITFPDVPYKPSGNNLYSNRKGFFVSFYDGHPPNFKVPGNTGGYLISENGKQIKVISGYLNGEVVSPDGCKITFTYYPYLDATLVADPAPITLKMINFCTEENQP